MMRHTLSIDLVIPILNEQDTLEQQINLLIDYIRQESFSNYNIQIILGDNGSMDQTPAIGQKLAKTYPELSYAVVPSRGVGLALKYCWGLSQADIIGYMDLDFATDLTHLHQVFSMFQNNASIDLINGSRLLPESKVIGRKWYRSLSSRVFNTLIHWYLGASFTDGMCGFKFLRRKHLEKLLNAGAQNNGWFFATELLTCAQHLKLHIAEIPVVWTDDPNSKVSMTKLTIEYLKAMHALKNRLSQP